MTLSMNTLRVIEDAGIFCPNIAASTGYNSSVNAVWKTIVWYGNWGCTVTPRLVFGARRCAALLIGLTTNVFLFAAPAPASTIRTLGPLWFSTPSQGFAVVTAETSLNVTNSTACSTSVGTTSDGALHFSHFVHVVSWNCASADPVRSLTFDGHGDGFLYGPRLYETHNDAKSWAREATTGSVLSVNPRGPSIWMLTANCPSPDSASLRRCPLALEESTNGGRTWKALATPPGAATSSGLVAGYSTGQTYLVRTSPAAAVLLSGPLISAAGLTSSIPLWVTSNAGRTWIRHSIPCGIPALSAMLSISPRGVWTIACAGEASAGFQLKSLLRSSDQGRSWVTESSCNLQTPATCTSPLENGYLGVLDAVTNQRVYEAGLRSNLNLSRDGGATWVATAVQLNQLADGVTQAFFFGSQQGLIFSAPSHLFMTTTDGVHWHSHTIHFD